MPDTITIPAETARHVLWQYGADGGYAPGTFTQHLLSAFATADLINKAKLGIVFPELGAAVHLAEYDRDGINKLRQIAGAA
ncbi:MAG TPA: hypothetical protein DEQ61_08365 [Streptomyces sp.]|nr:hypothetical protein [Streptomyces sp.]